MANNRDLANLADILTDGTSGNVLTANGAGSDPTWQAPQQGNAFTDIAVSGQSTVVADSASDTLTLAAGTNITITTNATTDTITIAAASGGATGGSTDKVFFENDQTVTTSYSITAGKNAMTAGPVTINSGITVTVPSGSVWTIV